MPKRLKRRGKKKPKVLLWFLLVVFLALLGIGGWVAYQLGPTPPGESTYVRYNSGLSTREVMEDMQAKGIVRNGEYMTYAAKIYDLVTVDPGTYRVAPGMNWREVIRSLRKPVRQDVLIPPGWWAARVGKRLEDKGVCTAKEYVEAANHPERFKDVVGFRLPEKSLEGYLFPDTYDLPPLLGADEVVRRQLRAFDEKVVKPLGTTGLDRALNIGAMVELEAAKDAERPIIAGVIENRIAKGQRLEMDATVLYALQEWKVLGPGVVHTVKSPYNTYEHAGLPPGPIGSPGKASIEAALHPAKHGYFFYVAKPDRTHIFSATYAEHLAAIKTARQAWAEAKAKAKP